MDEFCIRYDRIQSTVRVLLVLQQEHSNNNGGSSYTTRPPPRESVLIQPNHTTTTRMPTTTTTNSDPTSTQQEFNNTYPTPKTTAVTNQHHRYSLCNQSIYKLYCDLLFLELYSIMAFTSFSKILKKHDKVTGFCTRYDFMTKIVVPSNFVTYDHDDVHHRPQQQKGAVTTTNRAPLSLMIDQCIEWYDRISVQWIHEEKEAGHSSWVVLPTTTTLRSSLSHSNTNTTTFREDECLFLHMLQQIRRHTTTAITASTGHTTTTIHNNFNSNQGRSSPPPNILI
jgi:SPX domain